MKKYLLVHKEKGVFLGTYLGRALFAADNEFDIVKVFSFESEEYAYEFVTKYMENQNVEDYFVVSVASQEKYVHVVDIIKSGYGELTFDLADNIQMISQEYH